MSRIQITNDIQDNGAFSVSMGTIVKLDGQEIRSCRSVVLRASVDEVVQAIEVFADDSPNVDIGADVQIRLFLQDESLVIEETPLPGGGRRIRAVRAEVPNA